MKKYPMTISVTKATLAILAMAWGMYGGTILVEYLQTRGYSEGVAIAAGVSAILSVIFIGVSFLVDTFNME